MKETFGTLSDLGIRFQEAVLTAYDEAGIYPSNLSESDWNDFYTDLTEENFDVLVVKAVDVASGERGTVSRTSVGG
jgi:hypothetical protein